MNAVYHTLLSTTELPKELTGDIVNHFFFLSVRSPSILFPVTLVLLFFFSSFTLIEH